LISDLPMTVSSIPMQLSETKADSWNRLDRIFLFIIVATTVCLYLPTRHYKFVDFDDHLYVYRNVHVIRGVTLDTLRWAMTAVVVGNWHPLTILTELVIVSLFGPSAGAFHLVNALLHTLNVGLLYAFLRNTTGRSRAAFFVAILWGLHPLRVESVVWISELKDVLCGALWLGCMLMYMRYSRHRTFKGYALVILLLALALLAKPMAATLPALLLLLDFWPLNNCDSPIEKKKWWAFRIAEKLPMFAIAVVDMTFALRTQMVYYSELSSDYPLRLRITNGLVSYIIYLRDIFFPHHLIIFYPHPALMNQTIPLVSAILAGALLLVITLFVLLRAKAQPYLFVGWFWYVGTLVPVIGIVRLGEASHADRYTYLPSIGITLALVWWVSDLLANKPLLRTAAGVAGLCAAAALAIATSFTASHWQDTNTLFNYTRSVQPDNVMGLTTYCAELWEAGDINQAVEVGKQCITVAPNSDAAHAAYAMALQKAEKFPQAWDQMRAAIVLAPFDDDYWDGLGWIRDHQGARCAATHDPAEKDFREKAVTDFRVALKYNPDSVDALEHLAFELAALGRLDEAIPVWQKLITISPKFAPGQGDLADALRMKGDLSGAVEHFRAALAAGSKNPSWESQLAYLVATNPQATFADVQPLVSVAKDACDQTHNTDAGALDAYAACLARVGEFDAAVTTAKLGIEQANIAHTPLVAAGIEKRLARYQKQLPWVAGD
jgi:tetratricopeptide (TPR) repeat protein